ncbi:hypothetical protein FHS68_001332 [Dyadobacter arcticus]|uniref:Uncharacterized protein n=1 Tax=Dyadobacter arcticus TaxID=1078754 RepID=A0ABX0UM68_9BACT|nr:hypothetical protein [Dyadobacter arcticus]
MFYDFNKHKRQITAPLPPTDDDVITRFRQYHKAARQKLADQASARVYRLPLGLQRGIFIIAIGIGIIYCIYLILPNSVLTSANPLLSGIIQSHQTIQAATPSPKQEAFERYLDSLERAFEADSIFQSQQTIDNHAKNSIHP